MKLEGSPFEFEIAVDENDFWIGNENYDVHYYREGWEWENIQQICVYRVKDGNTDTSKEGTVAVYDIRSKVPLRPLKPNVDLSDPDREDKGIPIEWKDGVEEYIDVDDNVSFKLIHQSDEDNYGCQNFNMHIMIGNREAFAYSIDFEFLPFNTKE